MPLWLFILVLLLLLLLVAAAVVLPVVFVVLPKQSADNSAGIVGSCEKQPACQNGGTSVLSSGGYCECLCVNDYSGTTCETYSPRGCTMLSTGAATNATIGKAIPRLLEASQTNFSVPLDGQELLGLFSSSDLSCAAQNALVTFSSPVNDKRSLPVSDELETALSALLGRQATESTAATSNGIVYATGSPTATSSAGSSSTPSATPSGSADELEELDFARVAVLYVFEASGEVDSAATAQENLQSYFLTGQTSAGTDIDPTDVDLGNNMTCNLTGHTISLGNGTTVGGTTTVVY